MNKKINKFMLVSVVVIFLSGILVPSLVYANTRALSNGEEVICEYAEMPNEVEVNSFEDIKEKEYGFSEIGYVLLALSIITFTAKTIYEIKTMK